MFTGIIQQIGTIKKVSQKDGITLLQIENATIAPTKKVGDSIAIDGTCLTVTAKTNKWFEVKAIPETIKHTTLKNYRKGTKVNLENPLKVGDCLDGHLVQGHVDFVGTVKNTKKDGSSTIVKTSFPLDYAKYLAIKGSITVNGVSLTISKLSSNSFEVSLIPLTMSTTNLGSLIKGNELNIEIDIISRYLDSLLRNLSK